MVKRCLHMATKQSYTQAIACLNTLQSNAATLNSIGPSKYHLAIPEVIQWFKTSGYDPKDFNKLNSIHIAGTKGKGSTSAFISSILTAYAKDNHGKNQQISKIGLYTSPHLRFVRERIKINDNPITETDFAKYFFDIWNKLSTISPGSKPMYFRFLTLMAFHTFVKENIDTAIIECGIGGEYDSTNILDSPSITAITSLGIDHEKVLGNNIESIAWHKSGIFKKGTIGLTMNQPTKALQVLQQRAVEREVDLHVIDVHPQIKSDQIEIGIGGEVQKSNASLAAVIASVQLRKFGYQNIPDLLLNPTHNLPDLFQRGLRNVKWPGRCDIRKDLKSNITWYLDGAHTVESIQVVADWYTDLMIHYNIDRSRRILIFNQQSRDIEKLVRKLYEISKTKFASSPFGKVIFTTNLTSNDDKKRNHDLLSVGTDSDQIQNLTVQRNLKKYWKEIDDANDIEISITSNIQDALNLVRSMNNKDSKVLVTGSLHLIGGVLDILENHD